MVYYGVYFVHHRWDLNVGPQPRTRYQNDTLDRSAMDTQLLVS